MRNISIPGAFAFVLLLASPCFGAADLPLSLGDVRLGGIPPEKLLIQPAQDPTSIRAASRVRDLKPMAARSMWRRLVSDSLDSQVSGTVTLYKGRVVMVSLFSPDLPFRRVQAALSRRFGNGWSQENFVSEVPEGCEPYMLDHWHRRSIGLYLSGDKSEPGVGVHLRDDDLNHKMEADGTIHNEYETCGEF